LKGISRVTFELFFASVQSVYVERRSTPVDEKLAARYKFKASSDLFEAVKVKTSKIEIVYQIYFEKVSLSL
jgi:hypothetical protein